MNSRTFFIAALLLTAMARGLAADAQQAAKIPTLSGDVRQRKRRVLDDGGGAN